MKKSEHYSKIRKSLESIMPRGWLVEAQDILKKATTSYSVKIYLNTAQAMHKMHIIGYCDTSVDYIYGSELYLDGACYRSLDIGDGLEPLQKFFKNQKYIREFLRSQKGNGEISRVIEAINHIRQHLTCSDLHEIIKIKRHGLQNIVTSDLESLTRLIKENDLLDV